MSDVSHYFVVDEGFLHINYPLEQAILDALVELGIGSGTGTGDVIGPASSTVNNLPRFADTTGNLLKGSPVSIDDAGVMTGHTQAQSTVTGLSSALAAKKTDSMTTARLLGRVTAGTGAIEEIELGTNLSFTGNILNAATGGGGGGPSAAYFTTPEAYGATGSGTGDDTAETQAAIDAAAAAGGGIVFFTPGKDYRAGGLVMKSGVILTTLGGGVKMAGGPALAKISPPTGWAGGWVIDSPATEIIGAGVIGLTVLGNIVDGTSPDTGGIRIQDGTWCTVDSCTVASTSLGAIRVNGTANIVRFNGASNVWNYRSPQPTAHEGVIWLTGTDFWVEGNQANGMMALDATISTNVNNLYKCANFYTLYSSWLIGGNGEFSECGWRVSLYESMVWGIRGDTNPGIGMYVAPSTAGGTQYTSLKFLANCLSPNADGVHDQVTVNDYNNTFNGILLGPDWTGSGRMPRYGINDITIWTGVNGRNGNINANRYSNIRTIPGAFRYDEALRSTATMSARFNHRDGGSGNPGARPPARFAAGKTWYDTIGNKATFSNGTNWVDSAGAIVGNMMQARVAYANDGTIQWDPYNATSTVGTTYVARHLRPSVFTITANATAVTNGYTAMVQKTAVSVPVTALEQYQVGMYAAGPNKTPLGSIQIRWLNSSNGLVSTTTAVADTAIATSDSVNPTLLLSTAITAPSTATQALVIPTFKATSLANGDVFKASGISFTKGTAQTDVNEV